jgi:hypothetical protein
MDCSRATLWGETVRVEGSSLLSDPGEYSHGGSEIKESEAEDERPFCPEKG